MGKKRKAKLARRLEAERLARTGQSGGESEGGELLAKETPKTKERSSIDGYLNALTAFENGESTTDFAKLQEAGVALPQPESLDDVELEKKLKEVIEGLAARSTFLQRTDHLSDRALYTKLWTESLRVEIEDFPPDTTCISRIDIGNFQDTEIYLKYYATEDDYDVFDLAPEEIPIHVDPPFDRDRYLPQAPY